MIRSLIIAATVLLSATAVFAAGPVEGGVDAARVTAIATTLSDSPFSFGPKITDRAAWQKLAANPAYAKVIATAEKKLKDPMPPMTEEIYSLFKKTGQRTKQYSDIRTNRYSRIAAYTLAECVENKGRFIKPLEDSIADICTDPTWIFNFHDTANLDTWHGKRPAVDLGSILPAHDMATALVLLGDRLSPAARKLIVDNCRQRILDPYRHAEETGNAGAFWWMNAEMNWNAVCHCGVVGTALGVSDDKAERAFYIACAEKFSVDYLRGFGPDGYCAEGLGYWNYGYSNFIELAELCSQATGGKVNLYDLPNARAAAMYPAHLEIINGVLPAYADCSPTEKPEPHLAAFVNRRYGLGVKQWELPDLVTASTALPAAMMYSSPNSSTAAAPAKSESGYELRSYFDHGGVLTCRPTSGSACRMGVSLKGGNNDEPHNHNDLGTFVVAVGKESLILDPGGEIYTARTFSKKRYESNLLNSFGHPVPMVAGKLQRAGKDAVAKIIKTDFADAADTFAMDITSAYDVPELKQLVRTFTYTRDGLGKLTMTDEVSFTSPQSFGGAVITYGKWDQKTDHSFVISQGNESVEVSVDTAGVPFDFIAEPINEQTHDKKIPTRIGINLKQPIGSGKVVLTIMPLVPAAK